MPHFSIPESVSQVTKTLKNSGFEAYLIGGCVRDLFLGRKPKDWDITTNATPEQIISIFPETFYENSFGTVGIVNKEEGIDLDLKVIEVTPYRLETTYSDGRHPDAVHFSQKIEDDLQRRDFTINAIAYDVEEEKVVDLYGGIKDIHDGVIRAVGNPDERFKEDGLRILRAVRLSAELGFMININTENSIKNDSDMLKNIAKERIKDEFNRIIMSDKPMFGLVTAEKLGILKYIATELEEGLHVKQNQAHSFEVFEHLLRSLQCSADKKFPLEIRLAALFHDIGKPKTRRFSDEKGDYTFYGHDVVGARITEKVLKELKYPNKVIETVTKLVRWHMFFSDTEQITLSAVRRIVRNVGGENIWHLMDLRLCDRIGTGRPKESPYRLRKYHSMIEEVLRDPISVGMLKLNGEVLIKKFGINPGPKIGFILNALLEEVLDDPKRNTVEYLEGKVEELNKLDDKELRKLGDSGKKKREEEEEKSIDEIRKKHWVK